MRKIEALNRIYELCTSAIIPIEADRDHGNTLTEEDTKDLAILNKIHDLCRESSCLVLLDITEEGRLNFDIVNSDWIRKMLDLTGVSKTQFAEGVNVSSAQVSHWLSGERIPSGPAQAAIFYYFVSVIYRK